MDPSIPTFPPPAYHISHSHSHSHSDTTFNQLLQHIPTPQPQHLSTPSASESKWARRSLSSASIHYIPPPSPSPVFNESESKWARHSSSHSQDSTSPWDYTESRRNYRKESRRKFILFVVAILLMLAAMLAIVGAATHFRIRGQGCTTEFSTETDSWVCV